MATKIQIRRGTNAQRLTKTFDAGEIVFTTDTNHVFVGDGTTVGGIDVTGVSLPIAESDVTGLVADLASKAPLASPALTGTPTAPTAAAGTSTTQIATTAFAKSEAESAAVAMALIFG